MTTTIYPDPNVAVLPSVTKPTGYLGSLWTGGTLAGSGGANCRPMTLLTPGGPAVASALTTSQNTANVPWGCQQFVGPALSGSGTISGTVDIGFVTYCTGSNAVQAAIFIGIMKADGTLRATLLSSSSFDTAFTTTAATWKTIYVLGVALSSQSFADGDRIVVELGLQRTTTTTNQLATGAGGTTGFNTDHATDASGQSFLTFSQTLTLQAPAVPAITAAVTGIETVTVSWTRDPAATTYDLYRGTAAGTETLLTSGFTANSGADATALNNLIYYYYLIANGPGGSTTSNEVTAQPTTLFPDLGVAADQAPTAAYGAWQGLVAANTTTNAKALDTSAPAGPQTTIGPYGSLGSGNGTGTATFLSGPLTAQTIAGSAAFALADAWTVGAGRPEVFIAVLKGDNSGLRGTLVARTFFGTSRSSGGEETDIATPLTLSSVTALDGDRLLVEVGAGSSAGGSVAQSYNGTTRITTSGTSIASAQARLSFSQHLIFQTTLALTLSPASTTSGLTGTPSVETDLSLALSPASTVTSLAGTPSVVQELTLAPASTTSSLVGTPTVLQPLPLTLSPASTVSSLAGAATIRQELSFAPAATVSSLVGTPALGLDLALSPASTVTGLSGTPHVVAELTLSPASTVSGLTGTPHVTQELALAPASTVSSLTGTPIVGTPLNLTLSPASTTSSLSGTPTRTQELSLSPASTLTSLTGTPHVTQELSLSPAGTTSGLSGTPSTVTPLDLSLSPAGTSSDLTGAAAVLQELSLSPAGTSSDLVGDPLVLAALALDPAGTSSDLAGEPLILQELSFSPALVLSDLILKHIRTYAPTAPEPLSVTPRTGAALTVTPHVTIPLTVDPQPRSDS